MDKKVMTVRHQRECRHICERQPAKTNNTQQ